MGMGNLISILVTELHQNHRSGLFQVSPHAVHRMLTHLHEQEFTDKQPGMTRSLTLAIVVEQLLRLD